MAQWLEAILLGIVQGLTEFLPVSSSGHLEIMRYLFGEEAIRDRDLLMTVTLHAATASATLVVFRREIMDILRGTWNRKAEESRFFLFILLSMIPGIIVGLLLESQIESLFEQNMMLIASMLALTGLILLLSDHVPVKKGRLTAWSALVIGMAQAVAITPGISRSGATISTAVLLGIDRERAARFSFLMVIPLIFGKMAKDLIDGEFTGQSVELLPLILGAVFAFVVGWMACKWMVAIVRKARLTYFAIYCFIVAIGLWIL